MAIPESFKVLVKELQAIGLDIKVWDDDHNELVLRELDDEYAQAEPETEEEVEEAIIPLLEDIGSVDLSGYFNARLKKATTQAMIAMQTTCLMMMTSTLTRIF